MIDPIFVKPVTDKGTEICSPGLAVPVGREAVWLKRPDPNITIKSISNVNLFFIVHSYKIIYDCF